MPGETRPSLAGSNTKYKYVVSLSSSCLPISLTSSTLLLLQQFHLTISQRTKRARPLLELSSLFKHRKCASVTSSSQPRLGSCTPQQALLNLNNPHPSVLVSEPPHSAAVHISRIFMKGMIATMLSQDPRVSKSLIKCVHSPTKLRYAVTG